MIRFLHQQQEVVIENLSASTTILDYLREHRGLTGTKEGCASGDCGACTVVLTSATEEGLSYTPVNACIATVGSLHGKQLITVEDLKNGEAWHPVQRAMIECHGSQCGFCTPGFVMSLFALYHSNTGDAEDTYQTAEHSRETILEALGGNLCRCTGYRPIIDAAQQALQDPPADQFAHQAQATLDQLRALHDTESETIGLTSGHSRYFRPGSSQALASLLAEHPDAQLVAGGTDLLLESTQMLRPLPVLIDVCAADDLHAITADEQSIRLGAAVTHRACQIVVLGDYPELAELIERFGSLQIRSQGTVAGNIATASPIGDWPPVLLALDGGLELQSSEGIREIALADFFLGYRKTAQAPGEFLRSVIIPRRTANLFFRAYKISKRFDDDISSVCAVFALELDGDKVLTARVAFGGMAATPKRAAHCEAAFTGLDLREDSIDAAASALTRDFQPISDARASAKYRLTVAAGLIKRLQTEYIGDSQTRVHPAKPAQNGVLHYG